MVIAVNMMDEVRKNGDRLDACELGRRLGYRVMEISALKGDGVAEAAQAAVEVAAGAVAAPLRTFSGAVEHALASIEEAALESVAAERRRWYAIKLFERDGRVLEERMLDSRLTERIQEDIIAIERELDDDAESIITNERYLFIASALHGCYRKKRPDGASVSDRIDRVVTNRWAALPIFAAIMFLVYFVSVSTVGAWVSNWANEGVFGDGWSLFGVWIPGIPAILEAALNAVNCAEWLRSLVIDGILGGVGAVLGFVPQMLVLFVFLALLEACGYMARIAFVLDRVFAKFGLSGKSFIPMLIGTGCGVPGIMASRTIENERDRRMTVITTTFMPCGAKLPVIALVASALFDGAWWVAPSAYFIGIAAVITSGVILKKTRLFAGGPAPFVIELPAYHRPTFVNTVRSVWERISSFIKKAGTVILLSSMVIWAGSRFGWTGGAFAFAQDMPLEASVLGKLGGALRWIFAPLGFGGVKESIATVMGLMAKEEVVGVFGVLDFEGMSRLAAYSFMCFNLLCAPCFAAVGAIKREMNSAGWTWFAVGYQCAFAYAASLMIYQFGLVFTGAGITLGTASALLVLAFMLFMLLRPGRVPGTAAKTVNAVRDAIV